MGLVSLMTQRPVLLVFFICRAAEGMSGACRVIISSIMFFVVCFHFLETFIEAVSFPTPSSKMPLDDDSVSNRTHLLAKGQHSVHRQERHRQCILPFADISSRSACNVRTWMWLIRWGVFTLRSILPYKDISLTFPLVHALRRDWLIPVCTVTQYSVVIAVCGPSAAD